MALAGGSSPRVRGTPARPEFRCVIRRFIPRVRGTQRFPRSRQYDHRFIPRVRGTRACRGESLDGDRFIPACAGNTQKSDQTNRRPPVHPRVCGEHVGALSGIALGTVHPRVCGEHVYTDAERELMPGSSPRVRGTRERNHYRVTHPGSSPRVRGTPQTSLSGEIGYRFIPACAGEHNNVVHVVGGAFGSSPRVSGNTAASRPPFGFPAVHPRVCGEHIGLLPVAAGQ